MEHVLPDQLPAANQLQAGLYIKNGTVTSNFHARKARGEILPINPFEEATVYGRCTKGTRFNGQPVYDLNYPLYLPNHAALGTPLGPIDSRPNELGKLRQRIDNALFQKLATESFNAFVAIAEFRKTASLVANTCQDLAAAWRNLRRGNFGRAWDYMLYGGPRNNQPEALQTLGSAASKRWLEYQYGVKPLLADIEGSAKALENAYSKTKVQRVGTNQGSAFSGHGVQPYNGVGSTLWDVGYGGTMRGKGECFYTVDNPTELALQDTGITNPALLVWELIPLSFVADWFFQIGDWLRSFAGIRGLKFLYGNRTIKCDDYQLFRVFGSHGFPPSNGSYRGKFKERAPYFAFPAYSHMPDLNSSYAKLATGFALLKQASLPSARL